MGKLRKMIKVNSGRSATPTAADFAEFRSSIDKGQGRAQGMSARTRREALAGLDAMVTRCPHVLVLIAERGDVESLIEYARSRRPAAV